MRRVLNLQRSPADVRDFKLVVKFDDVKSSVDLSEHCTPVKDQGAIGSSSVFAALAALEFAEKKAQIDATFSEKFTYWAARTDVLGWPAEDTGVYVRDAIKSLVHQGACPANLCPNDASYSDRPSDAAYEEAKAHQLVKYASAPAGLQNIKHIINAGYPIVAGFTCFSNIWTAVGGVIPAPNSQPVGGHAVLLVGYNDTTRQLKFKNSWSTSWGVDGYGFLPYSFLETGNVFDMWCLFTGINEPDVTYLTIDDPNAARNAMKQSVAAKLTDVIAHIDDASDPAKLAAYFETLSDGTSNEVRMFLMNLRMGFMQLNRS